MKIRPVGADGRTEDRQRTDRYDEANSCDSQLRKRTQKYIKLCYYVTENPLHLC